MEWKVPCNKLRLLTKNWERATENQLLPLNRQQRDCAQVS